MRTRKATGDVHDYGDPRLLHERGLIASLAAAWLATLVCVFTLARVLHAWGMLAVNFPARRIGAGLTFLLEIVAVFAVLVFGVLA